MIVVDTSALIAVLKREPEAESFSWVMRSASNLIMGAPTLFEFLMVSERYRLSDGSDVARQIVDKFALQIEPWAVKHADIAQLAFLQFGKGRHPAKLNFGDCMSYALAKSLDAPLLYKGTDFGLTGIRSAV